MDTVEEMRQVNVLWFYLAIQLDEIFMDVEEV